MFKSLCLSGGGITGFVHLGVLHYLDEHRLSGHIDTLVCTSIGAVIGTLYSIGIKPKDIHEKMLNINNDIMQYSHIEDFFSTFGMETGEYFIAQLTDVFLEYKRNPKMTLGHVAKKYKKRLIITGTNLSQHSIEYFTPESHPHMRVLDALRISIAIPFLFTSIVHNGDYFVDGGLRDNFPIEYCINDLKNRYPHFTRIENYVFGSHIESMIPKQIKNLEDYLYAIFACCLKQTDEKQRMNAMCTIYVTVSNVSSMDFDADTSIRNDLFRRGESAAMEYLSNLWSHKTSKTENKILQSSLKKINSILCNQERRRNRSFSI
jgi:hypothetical protein